MLSKKIQAGNKAKEILQQGNSLSEEEYGKLTFLAEEGDIAFGQLVEANVPRAMKYAYETWQKNKLESVPNGTLFKFDFFTKLWYNYNREK